MVNARHNFALLWQRLVAALSLVMAAALAPGAVTSAAGAGAGAVGSRVGSGAAVASAAGALAGQVAALIEGSGQQSALPLDAPPDGTKAKACAVADRQEMAPHHPELVRQPHDLRAPRPTHAARSGPARAPPAA